MTVQFMWPIFIELGNSVKGTVLSTGPVSESKMTSIPAGRAGGKQIMKFINISYDKEL